MIDLTKQKMTAEKENEEEKFKAEKSIHAKFEVLNTVNTVNSETNLKSGKKADREKTEQSSGNLINEQHSIKPILREISNLTNQSKGNNISITNSAKLMPLVSSKNVKNNVEFNIFSQSNRCVSPKKRMVSVNLGSLIRTTDKLNLSNSFSMNKYTSPNTNKFLRKQASNTYLKSAFTEESNERTYTPRKIEYPVKPCLAKSVTPIYLKEIYYHSFFKCFPRLFQEKTYTFRRRRTALQQGRYFTDNILSEKNLIDVKPLTRTYYLTLDVQLDQAVKEFNNFNDLFQNFLITSSSEYVKKIITTGSNAYNSRVSSLTSFKNYLNRLAIKQNQLSERVAYIRTSAVDGDSYYRMFLFSMMEYHILHGNLREIRKIVLDVYKVLQNKQHEKEIEDKKEDIDRFFKVMYELTVAVDNNNIVYAHNILVSAFNAADESFDKVFVFYIRNIVYMMAEDFQNKIIEKYPHIKKSIINSASGDINDVNLMLLKNEKNEACKYALQILPQMYNINLELLIYDGFVENGKSSLTESYECFKSAPEDLDIEKKEAVKTTSQPFNICLIYFMNSYVLAYVNENDKCLVELQKHPEIYTMDSFEFKIEAMSYTCSTCKTLDKMVSFPFFGASFCLSCLKTFTNRIIERRVSNMNKENFHSREYYCHSFLIAENISLHEYGYSLLFEESIHYTLMKNMKQLCFACDEVVSTEMLIMKDCNCQYCKICLEKYIINYTKGHYILNKLEKNNYSKIKCPCNDVFELEKALELLDKDISEYKDESMQRLNKYAQTLCMRCIRTKRNDQQKKHTKEAKDYRFVSILEQKSNPTDKEISFSQHLLCVECIFYLKEKDMLENEDNLSRTKEIVCNICNTTHIVENSVWKDVIKTTTCKCSIL